MIIEEAARIIIKEVNKLYRNGDVIDEDTRLTIQAANRTRRIAHLEVERVLAIEMRWNFDEKMQKAKSAEAWRNVS